MHVVNVFIKTHSNIPSVLAVILRLLWFVNIRFIDEKWIQNIKIHIYGLVYAADGYISSLLVTYDVTLILYYENFEYILG